MKLWYQEGMAPRARPHLSSEPSHSLGWFRAERPKPLTFLLRLLPDMCLSYKGRHTFLRNRTCPSEEVRDPPALEIPHLKNTLTSVQSWKTQDADTIPPPTVIAVSLPLHRCVSRGVLNVQVQVIPIRTEIPFLNQRPHKLSEVQSPTLMETPIWRPEVMQVARNTDYKDQKTKEEAETKGKTNNNKKKNQQNPIKNQLLSNKNENWLLDLYSFLTQILRC